ncbi:MAG: UDP-glucose 4-epimerase GalE [Pseudomonadota bacterium]
MSTVFVTGGAGYVGSHACKALARAGYTPITLDNFVTGWRKAVKFGPVEEGDLLDRAWLDEMFAEHSPSAVLHFAALSNVGEASKDPALYYKNNVVGSLNLVDAAATAGVEHFVFSSTCAVFGDQDGTVLDEACATAPLNAYGASKLAVEHILRDYSAAGRLRYCSFRYFNVAGADPDAEIGEHHRPETHLIPLCLDAASGRRPALSIFGTDYPTRDGTCVRDYIHVSDLIEAHVLGLKRLEVGGESSVYCLGSGDGYSVREIISAVKEVTGLEVPTQEAERRPGDAVTLVSGSVKAADQLGWSVTRDLKEMIATAWGWHQKGDPYLK